MMNAILLKKIDKLFACGVGSRIALPQLVVVGDQSSGKSSVLEGLTELPFPRDSGLCTRFATQIIFSRAEADSITVSVIASPNASPEKREKVQGWTKTILGMSPSTFTQIMYEAHDLMDLGKQKVPDGKSAFSEDVLRLEICGPEQEHFSVVDVPGIFRKATEGLTTKADLEMVRSMVRSYMGNPRSVMLAVIPANVDIATQEILTMAEEFDKDGMRTIGVLTKPDLVDSGAEKQVIDLVHGEKHKLSLGWYLVRNLGQNQLKDTNFDRHSTEKAFFEDRVPWNTVDREKVGIGALRAQLQEVLAGHIRREFPKVKAELNRQLFEKQQSLKRLGPKRETASEQSAHLLEISSRFSQIVTMALNADYVHDSWFDNSANARLATAIVNRNEKLGDTINLHGHSYEFDSGYSKAPSTDTTQSEEVKFIDRCDDEAESASTKVKQMTLRETIPLEDLEELGLIQVQIDSQAGNGIQDWLSKVFQQSRGFELGSFDSSLLATTMKTQSRKWEPIAMAYIADVISIVHTFITDLLLLVCPDSHVRAGITSQLIGPLLEKYQAATDHAHFLLNVETRGTPATLNHYFNDNLEKSRQNRMRAALQPKAFNVPTYKGDCDGAAVRAVVRLDDIVQNHSMSNTEHTVNEVHDILKSYYKVARKRFADNLCMQAANFYLVNGPDSPLKLFDPLFVSRLSEDELQEIAGEDETLKRRRATLDKDIESLEEGKKIFR